MEPDMTEAAGQTTLRTLQSYEQQPELAVVSLLTMMSRFPGKLSAGMAESILGHLCLVADDERYPEALRQCASQLLDTWANYVELARLPVGQHGLH